MLPDAPGPIPQMCPVMHPRQVSYTALPNDLVALYLRPFRLLFLPLTVPTLPHPQGEKGSNPSNGKAIQ